jgi:hypothetical protein
MLSIVAPKTDHYSYKGFAALVPGASFWKAQPRRRDFN